MFFTIILFRTEVFSHAQEENHEENNTQDDVDLDVVLQQNSTQVQLQQNVCYDSFSGEAFQYTKDSTKKPAEFVNLIILFVFDYYIVQN